MSGETTVDNLRRALDDALHRKDLWHRRSVNNANEKHALGEQLKLTQARLTVALHERETAIAWAVRLLSMAPLDRPDVWGGVLYDDTDTIKHFRLPEGEGDKDLTGNQRIVEVRYDDAQCWTADEICAAGLHLERASETSCWMSVLGVRVWFNACRVKGGSRPELVVTCEPDVAKPYVVAPGEGFLQRHLEAQRQDATGHGSEGQGS